MASVPPQSAPKARSPASTRGSRIRRRGVAVPSSPSTTAPLPLLARDKTYSHVSPGVCDTCAMSREARAAWVVLLLGQLPSHRANAERTRAHLNATSAYITQYEAFERAYEEYLARATDSERGAASTSGEGDTLMDMVEEKERLLRANGLEDMF